MPPAHCSSTRAAFCSFIFSTFGRIPILYICALASLFLFSIFLSSAWERVKETIAASCKKIEGKVSFFDAQLSREKFYREVEISVTFSDSFRDCFESEFRDVFTFSFQWSYCFFRQPENPQVLGFRIMWTLWLDWASRKASLYHLQRRVKKA